jgi:TolB-like protein/DNA-binding winged helix-turn-helix (wHTH) protein/Flp pilus assembly protein TadD
MNAQIPEFEGEPARVYEFGPFRLDPRKRRLYRDGEVIPLSGKAYDALVVLVRCSGRVVDKDDLIKLVWPDTFVTDDSLTQSISVLRKALGETRDAPRFILTIPRRCYRFSGDVVEISVAAFAEPAWGGMAEAQAARAAPARQLNGIAGGRPEGGLAGDGGLQLPARARHAAVMIVVLGLVLAGGRLWFGTDLLRGRQASAGTSIHSVAVLPLDSLSGDREQDYVADGMTEALIARLGSLRNLRVISRTSAMQFKGGRNSVPEIARALAVDAVITGSVQRSGGRIRVTAHLIRSDPEEQLWSGTYDRDVRDVLALQSELALVIAREVDIIVTGPESARLAAASPAVSPEVYDHYLKGRFYFTKYTRASIDQSIEQFEAAITGDPTFAPAYLGLATAYGSFGTIMIGASAPSDVLPKAVAAAKRALELDPTLADAEVWLSDAAQQEWRWAEAESRLRRALELNPSLARAHSSLGWWLLYRGRTEEAIAESRRGRDLDPLSLDLGVELAVTLYMARRYDEAIRELQSILTLDPAHVNALMILGMAHVERARFDHAIRALEKGAAVSDRNPMILGTLAGAYARGGHRAQARRIVDELVSLSEARYVTPGAFVFAYMGLGEHDQAFAWLERGYAERTVIMKFLRVNPMFDPLRADQRFLDLVRRVGLDQADVE